MKSIKRTTIKCACLLLVLLTSSTIYSQTKQQIIKEINEQVWEPFSTAYKTLDFELFESIHHKDFLRINGNNKTLRNKDEYLQGYKENWQDNPRHMSIDFRFIERINSKTHASERGIYKMTVNPGLENAQSYYGQFHVILQKSDNNWKLLMDYDSNEGDTINEDDYNSAIGQNELHKF